MDSFSVLRKIIPKHLRMTIFVFSIKPFTRMALISHTYTLSSANTKPPLYFSSIPSFPLISSSTFSTCLLLFTFPSSPFLSCYLNAPLHPLLTHQHYHLILLPSEITHIITISLNNIPCINRSCGQPFRSTYVLTRMYVHSMDTYERSNHSHQFGCRTFYALWR